MAPSDGTVQPTGYLVRHLTHAAKAFADRVPSSFRLADSFDTSSLESLELCSDWKSPVFNAIIVEEDQHPPSLTRLNVHLSQWNGMVDEANNHHLMLALLASFGSHLRPSTSLCPPQWIHFLVTSSTDAPTLILEELLPTMPLIVLELRAKTPSFPVLFIVVL